MVCGMSVTWSSDFLASIGPDRNFSDEPVSSQPSLGWLSVADLPRLTTLLAAASAGGKLYAIGGYDYYDGDSQSTVYVYDPLQPAQGWLSLSSLPVAISGLAAASANGKIYAIGGYDGVSYQSAVYVYDPLQPALGWLSVSNLPVPSAYLAAASVGGKIYAIGGFDGTNYQSAVYVYDPSRPTLGWLSADSLPSGGVFLAAATVNDKIYAMGGYYSSTVVYEGTFDSGVVQSSGPLVGGNTVIISGSYLGNGDVTSVSLCGIPATILADNSPTQIVVIASSSSAPTDGDVLVCSSSYGVTVKTNGYAYLPPSITATFDGTQLQLSWPTLGPDWELQAQTNTPGLGLGTNWFPVANSTTTNRLFIPVDPNNPSVFFRLRSP
jgi:hypothetical protein